jgi:hypothetical protein
MDYLIACKPEYMLNGKIVQFPIQVDDERILRTQTWPGFHTEQFNVDVKH